MVNFCTNCGAKVRKEDNFCSNCGAKIDKFDIKQPNYSLDPCFNSTEKEDAKRELKRVVGGKLRYNKTFGNELYENGLDIHNTGKAIRQQVEKEIESGQIKSGGVEFRVHQLIHEHKIKKEKEDARIAKEKEEEKKKLKMIDEIFESEEIRLEIIKNNIAQKHVISIKDSLKDKIINKREYMSDEEIKYFIKRELKKVIEEQEKARIAKEKEMARKEMARKEMARKEATNNRRTYGGYCSISCRHYYEEFLDSGGAIVGDFDSDGYVEYYCDLGHSISNGRFCEYYE